MYVCISFVFLFSFKFISIQFSIQKANDTLGSDLLQFPLSVGFAAQ